MNAFTPKGKITAGNEKKKENTQTRQPHQSPPHHPPPILHVQSEPATAKSSRPVSSSHHQLAPISHRGKAKVLDTASGPYRTGPISSLTSSPAAHPLLPLEPHWTPRTNHACSCLRAFAQAVPPVYSALSTSPRNAVLCIACFLTSFNPCSNIIFSVRPFLTSSFPIISLPLLPTPLPLFIFPW